MSKSLEQFNLSVICQYHNKKCNLLCCFPGCIQRALCGECFSSHDYAHLTNVVALDSKSHFTPNLFTKQIVDMESEVILLQEKIKSNQNELYKELDKFIKEIQESFSKKIASFRRKLIKFVEHFNDFYDKQFLSFLDVLRKEYMDIDKIIKIDKDYFSSERVHNLLSKQNALETKIIPDLKHQNKILFQTIQARHIKLQKNDIFSIIDEKFNDLFQLHSFISCNKFPENSKSSFQPKNEITIFFENSLKKQTLTNVNVFTFSDKFPLPKLQEINKRIPFSYGVSIPRHFEIGYHKDIIKSLINLRESHIYASTSGDNIIKLWDLKTGKSQLEIQTYHKEMHAVCFVPEINLLLTTGKDLNIRIWDMDNNKCKRIIKDAHRKTIYCLVYLNDKTSFISGSGDALIKMWEISTGKLLNIFEGHENSIKSLFYIEEFYCFTSGGGDCLIKIWDLTQNKCKHTLIGHDGMINCFEYLEKKHWLFSGAQENKIKIWELFEDGYIKTLNGHNDGVYCLKLVNFNENLVSGGGDFLIKIWDYMKEDCILVLKGHQEIVSSVIIIRNDIFISGGWDHKIIFWKL